MAKNDIALRYMSGDPKIEKELQKIYPENIVSKKIEEVVLPETEKPKGMIEEGNIDLLNRPIVENDDGSYSTVRSIGINIDGQEILLPTVSDEGRILSDDEAIQNYLSTGNHLGKFKSVEESNDYAQLLHEQQQELLRPLLEEKVIESQEQTLQKMAEASDVSDDFKTEAINAFMAGMDRMNESIARAPATLLDYAYIPQNALFELIGQAQLQVQSPDWLMNNPIAEYYEQRAEKWTPEDLENNPLDYAKKGDFKGAAKNLLLHTLLNAPHQIALAGSFLAGIPQAGLGFAALSQGGEELKQSRDKDILQSQLNAAYTGAFEGLLERLGTFGIMNKWSGALAKSLGKKSAKEVMKKVGQTLVASFAGEANEEFATSLAQDFSRYATGIDQNAMKGSLERAANAGLIGGVSGIGITAPASIGRGVNLYREGGKAKPKIAVEEIDASRAQQAEQEIKKTLENSKEYGIKEEVAQLNSSETEVAHGSKKIEKENYEEVGKTLRNVRTAEEISPKEFSKYEKELKQRGFIDYRGTTAESSNDIAEMATAFRHPKIEQFQIFYVKDNTIVGHNVVSSGKPHYVNFTPKTVEKIKSAFTRLGADGIYFAHNHPSGRSMPSSQDIAFTAMVQKRKITNLKGHIVTNGDNYFDIYQNKDGSWDARKHTFSEKKISFRKSLKSIQGTHQVAKEVKKLLQNKKTTIVFLDNQLKILSIDLIGENANIQQYIKEAKKRYGSNRYVIVDPPAQDRIYKNMPAGMLENIKFINETHHINASFSTTKEDDDLRPTEKLYRIQEDQGEEEILPKKKKSKGGGKSNNKRNPEPTKIVNKPKAPLKGRAVKQALEKETGLKKPKDEVTLKESQALKSELRKQRSASKKGYIQGKKDTISEYEDKIRIIKKKQRMLDAQTDLVDKIREGKKLAKLQRYFQLKIDALRQQMQRAVNKQKQMRNDMIAKIKNKILTGKALRKEVENYIKGSLPLKERGRFLTVVRNADTDKKAIKAFFKVDNYVKKLELRDALQKLKKSIDKFVQSPSISIDYRKRIKNLISLYELQGHSKKFIDKIKATQDYIDKQESKGEDVTMPQKILDRLLILSRIPKNELTLSQVEALQQEVDLFARLGLTKWKSKQALYDFEKSERTEDLLNEATPINSSKQLKKAIGGKPQLWVKAYINIRNFFSKNSIALTPIDGLADITGMKALKRVMDANFSSYLGFNDSVFKQWEFVTKGMNEQNFEKIGVIAIANQEGGVERLANMDISAEDVGKIKLNEQEQKVYEFVKETFEKQYPKVKKYAMDVYNEDVGRVDNYVSFLSDYEEMSDLELYDRFGVRAEEEVQKNRTKTVEQGFRKKRAKVSPLKLELNIEKIFIRHMDDVAYMLTMGRDIKMYFEIVNSVEMKEKLGDYGALAWLQYLDVLARKGGTENAKRIASLDMLRRNVGAGILAFRLSSVLVQLSSFTDTVATIGGDYATSGATNIATSKPWRDFIMDNFQEVKKAVGDDITFREFGNNMFTGLVKKGYKPLQILDGIMRSVAAAAAYEKILIEQGKTVDLNNPDKDAIQKATTLMRNSQGSSFFKDQPLAITAGFGLSDNKSVNKTILTFQSFLLNRWDNINRQIWRLGIKEKNYAKAGFSALFLLGFSALMEEGLRRGSRAIINAITGDEREEKPYLQNTAFTLFQNVPVLGQIVSSLTYSSNPVPVINVMDDIVEGASGVVKHKKLMSKLASATKVVGGVGSFLGIPGSSQAASIASKKIRSVRDKQKQDAGLFSKSKSKNSLFPKTSQSKNKKLFPKTGS